MADKSLKSLRKTKPAGVSSHARPEKLLAYYQALRERWGDLQWWPGETRLEVMVGAVLTQNTAWSNVEKAITHLKSAGLLAGRGEENKAEQEALFVKRMYAAGPAGLAPLIRSSGYFNLKAVRLWNLLDWFVSGYDGEFERLEKVATEILREELLGVKGIGPETADSILLYALGRSVFVIDTYTHRVFKRHGLAEGRADYHALQRLALAHLPADRALFNDYHAQLVMVGKEFCKPTPRCEGCPLRGFLPGDGPCKHP